MNSCTTRSRLLVLTLTAIACAPIATAADEPATKPGFDQKLSLQGITFHVTCPNKGSVNHVRIQPEGLELDNKSIDTEVDGSVTGAEIADLNADGSPEIYIYTQSAGSGSYGSVIAYAANRKKSLSQITMPDLTGDPKASKGYMGHDEFAIVENRLARRFKLYGAADTNAQPTGKIRQISYRLHAGEAGWILRLDSFVDM